MRKTTRYNKIVVPDSSWWEEAGVMKYCDGFISTVNTIKDNVKHSDAYRLNSPSAIYFTRTAIFDVWREIGETALEKYFKKMGYRVLSPEKYSLEEQISMLMKCKKFAATEGSCSHSQIFCSQDAETTILRKISVDVSKYATAIADFSNCKTTYVDVNHSVLCEKNRPGRGPFYLTVTEELRKCFGISGGIPFIIRPSYWVYRYQKTILGKKMLYVYYLLLIARSKFERKIKGNIV